MSTIDFRTPAAGFDQPLELWLACHDRVRRMCTLLQRLLEHVRKAGVDEQAKVTAVSIRRYFDEAAPRHHEDEEIDLFPRLLQRLEGRTESEAAGVRNAITLLDSDHREMGRLWSILRDALLAGARYRTRHEDAERAVEPGDVGGAVRVLATRYEAIADLVMKRIALEERVPAIREAANIARAHHTEWLATVFARWLPRRKGAKRTLRLMALFGATEIYVWWSWRLLGLSPRQAEATMREMVEALLARWSEPDHGRGDE